MRLKTGEDFSKASNRAIAWYFVGFVNGLLGSSFEFFWIFSGKEPLIFTYVGAVIGWISTLFFAYAFMRGLLGTDRTKPLTECVAGKEQA